MLRKAFACQSIIFLHLQDEVINIFKMFFIAEFFDIFHFHSPTIQISVKIKQMNFNKEAFTTDRRPCTEACHAAIPTAIAATAFSPSRPDGKNTLQRAR